jgi:hypothetical protein
MAFFQHRFSLLACDFLHSLLYLNPNSILQIADFIHICEAYLTVLPNFLLFKQYFFIKYQPSASKRQVMGGVGVQDRPHWDFLNLPLKTSLKGWRQQWFYCENHELSLPPFAGRLPKYDATWIEEPVEAEMPTVKVLASWVSELQGLNLIGVHVVNNWLAHRVAPVKKQVHLGWEYWTVEDPTRESSDNIEVGKPIDLLKEMFQNINSWPTPEQVLSYHLQRAIDPIR